MSASSIIGEVSSFSASHFTLNKESTTTLTAVHPIEAKQSFNITAEHGVLPKTLVINYTAAHNTKDYGYGSFDFTLGYEIYPRRMSFTADLQIDPNKTLFTASHKTAPIVYTYQNGITSSIAVEPPISEALQGKMSVRETNTATGTSFIWGVRDGDLDTKLEVNRRESNYLGGRISVRENNQLQGKVPTIWGDSEGDLVSSIYAVYPDSKDLPMQARIRGEYTKEDTIEGVMYGYSLISQLAVNVKTASNVMSSVGVRFRNSMTGDSFIWGTDDSDVLGSIDVYQVSDLPMSLGVTPSSKMSAIVDIEQPMRITDNLPVKRDAFVREAYPRLNYGSEQTIVAGYSDSRQEIFRSLLGFDIRNIADLHSDYKIEHVTVKLKHTIGRTPTIPLELMAVTSTWVENSVTWNNQPDAGAVVSQRKYTTDEMNGFITFDVTDFVVNAKSQGVTDISFYLLAGNEKDNSVQFFSREASTSLAPSMEYTYFDEVIRSTGRSGIDTKILVTYPRDADLKSKINVYKHDGNKDLQSKVTVTPSGNRFENLLSSLAISRQDVNGKGTVRQNTWGEIPSGLSVQETDLYDLDNGSITVSRPDAQARIYVANRKDTASSLGVRVWDEEPLLGWLTVNIKDRPATVYVRPYIDNVGKITVRQSDDYDKPSSLTVSERVKVGRIYVLHREDFGGTLIVQGGEDNDIPSNISVSRPDVSGSIKVHPYKDTNGRIVVRRSWEKEIPANITVTIPDMLSQVYVRFTSDIVGEVTVIRAGEDDISGGISVSRPDIAGTIQARLFSELDSNLVVQQDSDKDIDAEIIVPHRYDVPSVFNIIGANMIPSSIRINSGNLHGRIEVPAYGHEGIDGVTVVRVRLAYDIDSVVDVYQFDLLDSSITVKQSGESDVDASIQIKQADDTSISSVIDVWITNDIAGSIAVRREETDDIGSQLEILNRVDLKAEIEVLERSNLTGLINVMYLALSEVPGQVVAKIRTTADLDTRIDVTRGGSSDVVTKLGVAPSNKMTAIVDVIQPIREVETITPNRDTYVSEDVPTLNYGEETSFSVGNHLGKKLRSLLGFNITSLKLGYDIEKVELKLYYGQLPTKKLRLMGVDGTWTEFGTTWDNRPNIGVEVSSDFRVNASENYVVFDVTEFVNGKYVANTPLVDFYIVAEDETEGKYEYFFSKETQGYVPKLSVTYFNPAVWSAGRASVDSLLTVLNHHDLRSRLRIRVPATLEVGIPASLEVTRNNEFTGVITLSKPNMPSTVHIVYGDVLDIPSTLGVANKGSEPLQGSLNVSRDSLLVSLDVKYRTDLNSNIGVRRAWQKDTLSWITVNVKERPASLYVLPHNDIQLRFTVRELTGDPLPSFISVNRDSLTATVVVNQETQSDIGGAVPVRGRNKKDIEGNIFVYVPVDKDLYSEIVVRKMMTGGEYDITGRITVSRQDMAGAISVTRSQDLTSSLNVVYADEGEIGGQVYVRNTNDVGGRLDVWGASKIPSIIRVISGNLSSIIAVPAYSDVDLESGMRVMNRFITEIPSTIQVHQISEVTGGIAVRRSKEEDWAGKITVIRNEDCDIFSTITPVLSNYLPSRIGVRFDNLMTGESDIIPTGYHDLNSNVDVAPAANLNGSIEVVIKAEDDIAGVITVRARTIREIDSFLDVVYRGDSDITSVLGVPALNKMTGKVFIIPVVDEDLPSSIYVLFRTDLNSSITVRRSDTSDIKGSITARARDNSDITGSINTIQWNILKSQVAVRRENFSEIVSSFIILTKHDTTGTIVVRNTEKYDRPSTISVRRDAEKDVDGRIVARQSDTSDIISFIETWQFRTVPSEIYILHRNDIVSTIDVVADYGYCFIM